MVENTSNRLWNPMEIKWPETQCNKIAYLWNKVPQKLQSFIVTLSVFIFGISLKGDWLLFVFHCINHYNLIHGSEKDEFNSVGNPVLLTSEFYNDLTVVWPITNLVAYLVYFLLGGFLHWYFYVRQRDSPEKWKCQPDRWLSPELELDEIFYGSISLLVTNTYSSILTCYVKNGGGITKIYYRCDEYSWIWWFLQWPVIFVWQDYLVFLIHRTFHLPYFYKKFHKMHHKYKQPTAFSVTALHPVEILSMQTALCSPIFFIPTHWFPFYVIVFFTYFNGIIDHSGIAFKAPWWEPWKPDTIFHDNHHQYFHVNFGFNCYFWDKLHGTYRKSDRIYNENIFYGKGKLLSEATDNELKKEEVERNSENPRAHRRADSYVLPKKQL